MNTIFAVLLSVFLTTMTPPPPTPTATMTPAPAPATVIAVFSSADAATDDELQAAASVLEQRLDAFNVEYVAVTTETSEDGATSVQVEILPEHLTERVITLLTQPGYLELVDVSMLDAAESADGTRIWTTAQEERFYQRSIRLSNEATREPALVNPETNRPFKTILDGTEIIAAEAQIEPNSGAWIIEITFSDEGAALMEDHTVSHVGEALAIVLDGAILTAPVIQSRISSPIWLQGNYTEADARELAAQLTGGPLPIALEYTGVRSALGE